MSDIKPVGEVQDFFLRIEFQQRGSPHVHMMLWCKNSPTVDTDADNEVLEYIDKFLTCRIPTDDPVLEDLVGLQRHRHSHTCKMKGKKVQVSLSQTSHEEKCNFEAAGKR